MITRRSLVGGLAASMFAPAFLQRAAESAAANTIVVVVLQAGGNDGLNTVIPMSQYAAYTNLRKPKIAPAKATLALNVLDTDIYAANTGFDALPATPSNGANQYAFHPVMTSMRALYATGNMAVVTGAGLSTDERNRFSHEVGQFDWASGKINSLGYTTTGWLGTALDRAPAGPLGATISLTGKIETILIGAVNEPLALGVPLESFQLAYGGSSTADTAARKAGFVALQGAPSNGAATAFVRALSGASTTAIGGVQAIAQATATFDYIKPRNFLDAQLREIARMIVTGAGARAYFAIHGGYDTHHTQNDTHPALLGQFSDGLATFYAYLRSKGVSSNVLIMNYADFGRRAAANDNYGTDHGSTQINFVIGDAVRGGVYGAYPNLSALDTTGNLGVQVDYRNVIADVISYLGADQQTVLGKTYPKLGFV